MREEGRHEESAEEVINVDEDVCRGEDKGTVKLWTAQLSINPVDSGSKTRKIAKICKLGDVRTETVSGIKTSSVDRQQSQTEEEQNRNDKGVFYRFILCCKL